MSDPLPPAGQMLKTVAVFGALAGALSTLLPYFSGLALALAALAGSFWIIAARKRWTGGIPGHHSVTQSLALLVPLGGASAFVSFFVPFPWNRVQGLTFAAIAFLLWFTVRRWGSRRPGIPP